MRSLLLALLTSLVLSHFTFAQPTPDATPNPAQLEAAQRLGSRVSTIASAIPTAPVLLIAPDSSTYLHALSEWSLKSRFPILIDDGTARAAENIARFTRAFQPKSTLVLESIEHTVSHETIRDAILHSWSEPGTDIANRTMHDAFGAVGFTPFGVVVTSLDDKAWTAAAALAAYRGQHIAYIDPPAGRLRKILNARTFQSFNDSIVAAVGDTQRSWRAIGDDIEAITIAANMPQVVKLDSEPLALTDLVGRHASGIRYAWAGVIHGNEADAAYKAMSAIFIQPRTAWLFDAYEPGFGTQYDVTQAGATLRNAGFSIALDAEPRAFADWQRRTNRSVSAGLLHVQTHGQAHMFHVLKQRVFAREVPLLETPAFVHFIHSFSAQRADALDTIAARWIDEGAAFYVGSVHEPYLSGFVPPQILMSRALSGFPLGAAARWETGRFGEQPWKVNVLGDPLITLARIPEPDEQTQVPTSLTDRAEELENRMKAALTQRDLDSGLHALVLLGRDADAYRFAQAALTGTEESLSARSAALALTLARMNSDSPLALKAFAALPDQEQRSQRNRNRVWGVLDMNGLQDVTEDQLMELAQNTSRFTREEEARKLSSAAQRIGGIGLVRLAYEAIVEPLDANKKAEIKAAMGL